MVSSTTLVLVLALFLAFAGFVGLLVGRTFRDGERARDTAGNIVILAVLFAAAAVLIVEFAVTPIDEFLEAI